jgi:hypothetical protein
MNSICAAVAVPDASKSPKSSLTAARSSRRATGRSDRTLIDRAVRLVDDNEVEVARPELDLPVLLAVDQVHHRRICGEEHPPLADALGHEVHRRRFRQVGLNALAAWFTSAMRSARNSSPRHSNTTMEPISSLIAKKPIKREGRQRARRAASVLPRPRERGQRRDEIQTAPACRAIT